MTNAASPPAQPADRDALRIVLFGPPAAGKSSLLGALAESAATQQNLLNGKLTDLTHGLDELRKRLYDGRGRRTGDEVVPYPVDFEPFSGAGEGLTPGKHFPAIAIDSDGQVANELLARQEVLSARNPQGVLARELVRADAVLLIVDASGTLPQMDAEFAAFDRFLELLEQDRGERTEVSGLPVYLVLTKCDLLAKPGESAGSWIERIEDRKRDVDTLFRQFLARRTGQGSPVPFGELDVHVWATAVKRPALGGSPARDREPFGVAELFRQALQQTVHYRGRREHSGRRLAWTAGGAAGLAAAMLAMMIGLAVTNHDTPANDLRARVEEIRSMEEPAPAARLHGTPADLRVRLADFTALQNDPEFASLPTGDKEYVRGRISELQSYIAYYDNLRSLTRPGDVAETAKLRQVAEQLQSLAPPEEWAATDAGRFQADRLAEAQALDKAVARATGWYEERAQQGRDLWVFSHYLPTPEAPAINWRGWYDEAARVLDPTAPLPSGPNDPIPGTKLTYATALRFDRASEARAELAGVRDKLQRVVDIGAALGLVGDIPARPAVLVIPRPPGFPLEQSAARLKELQTAYPRNQAEFVLAGLPDAVLAAVRQAARVNYEYLLEPARGAILQRLQAGGGADDTPARWAEVGAWLGRGPQELAAWRALAFVLARLSVTDAADPVTALAEFLAKPSFPIEIRQVSLEVPFRYADVKPRAGAEWALYHPATVPEGPAVACVPAGEGERDDSRKVTVYTFRAGNRQRLTYRPGEELWASLALRDGQTLTWSRGHSNSFQFERLVRPPRLNRSGDTNGEGSIPEGITLTITPPEGVPRVPDLMPDVPARKK